MLEACGMKNKIKIQNIFVLVEIEDKIYQAVLDEDQKTAVKSLFVALGKTVKILDKPLENITTK